jgi:hypothetical protein
MNEFEIILAVLAVFTAIIARNLPRAWLWIAAGALSFAASSAYWKFGLPHHGAFTLVCDSLVCLSIYFLGREQWETRLYNVFQFSVLISILRMAGFLDYGVVYAGMLELCNLAALLLIGGTAILDGVADENRSFGDWSGNIHRVRVSLRKARAQDPFHKVRH